MHGRGNEEDMVDYTVLPGTMNTRRFRFEIRMLKRPSFAEQSLVKEYLSNQSLREQKKIA